MQQEECRFLKILDITLALDVEYTAWQVFEDFLILGTNTGSILFYNLQTQKNCGIIASSELMEASTKIIAFVVQSQLVILLGTKRGNLASVNLNAKSLLQRHEVIQPRLKVLNQKLSSEVVDVFISHEPSFVVWVTKKQVLYTRMQSTQQEGFTLLDRRVCFQSENDIIQANFFEKRVLVSTMKSYFIVDIFSNEALPVGTKEKNGPFGSTFFRQENEVNIYAARINGILWKASMSDGKVITSAKFTSEKGEKIRFGLLYSTKNHVISVNDKKLMILSPFENAIILDQEYEKAIQTQCVQVGQPNSSSEVVYIVCRLSSLTLQIQKLESKQLQKCVDFYYERADIDALASIFEEREALKTLNNAHKLLLLCEKIDCDIATKYPGLVEVVEKLEDESWRTEQEKYAVTVIQEGQNVKPSVASSLSNTDEAHEDNNIETDAPKFRLKDYNRYIQNKIEDFNFRVEISILLNELHARKQLSGILTIHKAKLLKNLLKLTKELGIRETMSSMLALDYRPITPSAQRLFKLLFSAFCLSSYELKIEHSLNIMFIVQQSRLWLINGVSASSSLTLRPKLFFVTTNFHRYLYSSACVLEEYKSINA